jgi:hypothetical protein
VDSLADKLKSCRRRLSEAESELKEKATEVRSLGINRKFILSAELKSSIVKIEARYEEL